MPHRAATSRVQAALIRGEMDLAVREARAHFSLHPCDIDGQAQLAQALAAWGVWDDAIREVDKALERSLRPAKLLAQKGDILYESGRYGEALRCYREAASDPSTRSYALARVGCIYLDMDQWFAAKRCLKRCTDPHDSAVLLLTAIVRAAKKDVIGALAAASLLATGARSDFADRMFYLTALEKLALYGVHIKDLSLVDPFMGGPAELLSRSRRFIYELRFKESYELMEACVNRYSVAWRSHIAAAYVLHLFWSGHKVRALEECAGPLDQAPQFVPLHLLRLRIARRLIKSDKAQGDAFLSSKALAELCPGVSIANFFGQMEALSQHKFRRFLQLRRESRAALRIP